MYSASKLYFNSLQFKIIKYLFKMKSIAEIVFFVLYMLLKIWHEHLQKRKGNQVHYILV